MPYACDMKNEQKEPCSLPAVHTWGPVHFCCHHFDLLIAAMYDLNEAVSKRRHTDLVDLYEERTGKSSRMMDMGCAFDPPKDKDKK